MVEPLKKKPFKQRMAEKRKRERDAYDTWKGAVNFRLIQCCATCEHRVNDEWWTTIAWCKLVRRIAPLSPSESQRTRAIRWPEHTVCDEYTLSKWMKKVMDEDL